MKMTIKEFLNFMDETHGSFEVIDSCDTNDFDVRDYNIKIYVDDNTYTSVDELPNKNAHVRSWHYTYSCFVDPCLEIWCD